MINSLLKGLGNMLYSACECLEADAMFPDKSMQDALRAYRNYQSLLQAKCLAKQPKSRADIRIVSAPETLLDAVDRQNPDRYKPAA